MIKVKLKDQMNAINLAARLAAELSFIGVLPIIKKDEIILDDSSSSKALSIEEALQHIRNSLEKSRIDYGCIYFKGGTIYVEDFKGRQEVSEPPLFFCPFCGYSTPYEEIYWIHVKSHGVV